jgi:hypothetical protein
MKENNLSIFAANEKMKLVDPGILSQIMSPSFLLKEGFTMEDLKLIKSKTPPQNLDEIV